MSEREPEADWNPQPPEVYRRRRGISYEQDIELFTIGDWVLDTYHLVAATEKSDDTNRYRHFKGLKNNLASLTAQLTAEYPEIGQEILEALQHQDTDADFGEIGYRTKGELERQQAVASEPQHPEDQPPDDPSSAQSGLTSAG